MSQTQQSKVVSIINTCWEKICTDINKVIDDISIVEVEKTVEIFKQQNCIQKQIQRQQICSQTLNKQQKQQPHININNPQQPITQLDKQSKENQNNHKINTFSKIINSISSKLSNDFNILINDIQHVQINQHITYQNETGKKQCQNITNKQVLITKTHEQYKYLDNQKQIENQKDEIMLRIQKQLKELENQQSDKNQQTFKDNHNQKQTQIQTKTKQFINFQPFVIITEIENSQQSARGSRSRKIQNKRSKPYQSSRSIDKKQWSLDVLKLKEAKRKKKVLQQQLSDIKQQIDLLQNPQKNVMKPKIKQMIKIADDAQANLKALMFVRKMNNQRKQKQYKLKIFQQRQNSQMFDRMQQMQQAGEYHVERKRLKKVQLISERVEEMKRRKNSQRKLKAVNMLFIDKMKKDKEMTELEKRKSKLKKIRNLEQGSVDYGNNRQIR